MSVFGQVWLWSLAAFVLGALLTWLLLVRPARARVRELERRVVAHRAEPVAVSADHAVPANDAVPASDAVPGNGVSATTQPEPWAPGDQQFVPERGGTDHPATELFEPVNAERTEYLPPTDGRTRVDFGPEPGPPAGAGIGTALDPAQAEPAESRQPEFEHEFQHTEPGHVAPEPARGLFQPALPSTPPYEQDAETVLPEPVPPEPAEAPGGDGEPASEALLPKRQRRDSPLGGFDPPEPIQPSMRAVARREPVQGGHSGSLFEPGEPEQPEPGVGHGDGPSEQPASEQPAAEHSEPGASVGPFGPGSAMPLPGGSKPSEDFTVKASVTTLRYCPPESAKFDDIVAEVWFRTAHDAERVGFRPID